MQISSDKQAIEFCSRYKLAEHVANKNNQKFLPVTLLAFGKLQAFYSIHIYVS